LLQERLALARELKRRIDTNKLGAYRPYAKQREFHEAGRSYRERLFLAGNQLGKTIAGAAEMAMHLTGRYPGWWQGRRWDRPIAALAGSESAELTRDGVQRLLLGPPSDEAAWGTGLIPGDAIVDHKRRMGVADAVDTIVVKHASGGNSTLGLKSYDQGRSKWQANTVDAVWLDEESPPDIYFEALTRTNATGGMVFMTFTPIFGMSEIVRRFLMEESPDRTVITMTIDDAEHFTPEERARIIASYPPHEREARTRGIPSLGSGRIFPIAEEAITCEAFEIPRYWAQIGGLDFGWDHPTAAVRIAHDRDTDVVYVVSEYKVREQTPLIHAAALKKWAPKLQWAWPHDGLQHDKGSGIQLAEQYRDHGLDMLFQHAKFPDGSNGVEAGIFEMLDRMQTGRLKVFGHMGRWLEEFRLYHREDGKVIKEFDDLMSATRYALMCLRYADPLEQVPASRPYGRQPRGGSTSWMTV
jgi:phage terminase large subunit-like protein